jgi:glucose-6-phosphate dehydrogenase assembly protein OpcA
MVDAGAVWSEQDTTPGEIEVALRDLLRKQYQHEAYAPARVLNLVVVLDREWRGEILNRLENVGRYHASRTILCTVEPGRDTIDASLALTTGGEHHHVGELALMRERIVLDVGTKHLDNLDTVVDPLVVSDIPTVIWSPHGHSEALDSLLHLSQVVLIDSVNEPDPRSAVGRAQELAKEAYIVDLAWLRGTPWRERVASTFDPPQWRDELRRIDSVRVHHRPDSGVAGVLFCGWLASRLAWDAGSLMPARSGLHGKAHGKRQDVALELMPDESQSVPGLAGIEIATSSGMSIALDRGPGGLSARRTDRKGHVSEWTVLGASRGEGGILGEGIRQALLRDKSYVRALDCAEAMLK